MAYDPGTGQLVLFGGADSSGRLNDTWTWDGSNWTHQSPASSPPARYVASMAYDPGTGQLVLFGGYGTHYFGDTWTWNGSAWTQQSPASSPPARLGASMTYGSATAQLVLFGGYNGGYLGDTWAWNGSTWAQQSPSASPPPRDSASTAYDPGTGQLVVFGGQNTNGNGFLTYLNDTWSEVVVIGSTINSVVLSGSAAAPTITVTGSGFGSMASLGAPQTPCGPSSTGSDYGNNLSLADTTQAWDAGQGPPAPCDDIGLVISSYSNTQIVFTFGSNYPSLGSLTQGDSYTMNVLGGSLSGIATYPPAFSPVNPLSPNQVAVGASSSVTFSGSGFVSGAKIVITGPSAAVKASKIVVSNGSDTMTATIKVPSGTPTGAYTVTVTNPDHSTATCTNCLNVIAAPTLASISPPSVARGSTNVPATLTGTGFATGATLKGPSGVSFNTVVVVNATTITARVTVSAGATTGNNLPVTVTNSIAAGHGNVTANVLTIT